MANSSQTAGRKIQGSRYSRTSDLSARMVSEENREVEISFSSEQPVERWFGQEILCHDAGCMNLDRLTEVGSLLFHHGRDANYGSLPVGRIVRVWAEDGTKRAKAVIAFDQDEKSDLIYQKVRSGSLRGISVGYSIDAAEEVKPGKVSSNGRFSGPCTVATRWTPYEISVEPVPADDSVGIGRANEEITEGEKTMSSETQTQAVETSGIQSPIQPEARTAAAVPTAAADADRELEARVLQQERMRVSEIQSLCREFNADPSDYISKGNTVDEVRAFMLEKLKAANKPLPASRVSVVEDEEDKYRAAAASGLTIRMGFKEEKPAEGYRDFLSMSLRDLMVDCASREGVSNPHRMSVDELMRHALGFERGALEDSSAFLSVVNSSMHAVMSQAYQTAPTTYQQWTSTGSNSDFKPSTRYRLSASGEMQLIPENGEFKNDTVTDEGVDTRIATYGKKFGFGRQTIINDSLGTVAKAIASQVRSVQRFKNRKCYERLCKNAAMQDKKLLYSVDHKNLFPASTLSLDSLNEMIVAMALQQDMSGQETLNITPKFLIVPVAMEMAARRLIESTADPDAPNNGVYNPMRGRFTIISDAVVDTFTKKGYFAVADPMDVDTIEVTYLNGQSEPVLESQVLFDQLGVQYRMYHDFGVTALDFRGLSFNPGK